MESLGVFSESIWNFLDELGRGLFDVSADVRGSFCSQRVCDALRRFNSVLLHDSFVDDDPDH